MEQNGGKGSSEPKPRYVWDHKKLAWVETTEPIAEEVPAEPTREEDLEEARAESAPVEAAAEITVLHYASVLVRLGAFAIDFIGLALIDLLIRRVVGTFPGTWYIISGLYFVGFWTWRGQTVAKIILGLQVVKTDFRPIGFGSAFLRYIVFAAYFTAYSYGALHISTIGAAVVLFILFLIMPFSRKKRGLHDLIAGTCVVSTRRTAPQLETVIQEPDTAEQSDANEPYTPRHD